MLKVTTTRFGDVEVNEGDVIELPTGLIGFPELKRYVLFDHDRKDSPFKWLQSLDDGAIAFVLINPLLFKSDYSVEVSEAEVKDLSLESEEDAVISVIVTLPSDPKNMTANLKAPLVFNLKNRRGRQVILSSSTYTTKHSILEEVNKRAAEADSAAIKEVIEKVKDSKIDETEKVAESE